MAEPIRAVLVETLAAGTAVQVEIDAETGIARVRGIPVVEPQEEAEPPVACPEGFHWMGQSFAFCEKCGLPAWEHEGLARVDVHPGEERLFGPDSWQLRPWRDGERQAVARRWEPELLSHLERRQAPPDRCDPLRNRHRSPHVACLLTDKQPEETQ